MFDLPSQDNVEVIVDLGAAKGPQQLLYIPRTKLNQKKLQLHKKTVNKLLFSIAI